MEVINIGISQGCVLSPIFLHCREEMQTGNFLYTFFYVYFIQMSPILQVCLIDDSEYKEEGNGFNIWCKNTSLQLNVGITKEMVIHFSKRPSKHLPLYINDEIVEKKIRK